jgi:hypothetical protein
MRWWVDRPIVLGAGVLLSVGLERPSGRKARDWFRTTKIKNMKATQNQRPIAVVVWLELVGVCRDWR